MMSMTEADAIALAAKRELHKSKHMTHKRWIARHDSVKGWHVALVDNHVELVASATVGLEGVAIALALFGPIAVAKALSILARKP